RDQQIFRRHHDVPAGLRRQQLHTPLADLIRYDDFHLSPSDLDSKSARRVKKRDSRAPEKSSKVASRAFSDKSSLRERRGPVLGASPLEECFEWCGYSSMIKIIGRDCAFCM